MLLLASMTATQMRQFTHPHLGRLVTPRIAQGIEETAELGILWAADNDAFQGFHERRYNTMLDQLVGLPGCRFVACPDIVGDAAATNIMFRRWAPGIARRGLPIGYVLQDGITANAVPWLDIDAVFVGGTDAFKGSPQVAELVAAAKDAGLWAHMGRVNSTRRIRYAASINCDSVDGTKYARWRDTHLRTGLAIISSGRQLALAKPRFVDCDDCAATGTTECGAIYPGACDSDICNGHCEAVCPTCTGEGMVAT